MDIRNIALVRATNVIPFDGIVRPISEVPYLTKETATQFCFVMNDLLKEKGLLKKIDFTKWGTEEYEQIQEENTQISNQYMPYTSNYNSMVLWALNGLVPDDMNNTFSNKECAIIDGLAEQIEQQAEIVSIVPTDTAIKGNVKLSNRAIILIKKERYEILTQEEKEQLDKWNMRIVIFEGDLKENVDKVLIEEGRYTAETLSLRREDDGYKKSDTNEEVRSIIRSIASERKIAQVLHWNVITGASDELDKLESVKDEFYNSRMVIRFYKNTFFEYLFSKIDIDEQVKRNSLNMPETTIYMRELCGEIDKIGIEKYKTILDKYNNGLEKLRDNGKLPTPQQIINSLRENKKIDLVSMIEEYSNEDIILLSAIEKTEEITRTGIMEEQMGNFEQLINGTDKKDKSRGD